MGFLNHKVSFLLGCVALIFTFIKAFTAIVLFRDDPSSFFVIRRIPAFDNYVFATEEGLSRYFIIAVDENEFIGEPLYVMLTNYLWWVSILVFIISLAITFRNKNY